QGVQVRMPASEGAYDLLLRAEPAGMRAIERVVQFVVVAPDAPARNEAAESSRVIQGIDPARPDPSSSAHPTRPLLGRTTRLGQLLWRSMRPPFTAADRPSDAPVHLCRLNIQTPGVPHIASIDYEDNGSMRIAACVTEQDGSGKWVQVPVASGAKCSG